MKKFLMKNLTAEEYASLAGILGITKHRLGKITANPRLMTLKEIQTIASLTGKPVTEIISDFNAGADIVTIGEMEQFQNNPAAVGH